MSGLKLSIIERVVVFLAAVVYLALTLVQSGIVNYVSNLEDLAVVVFGLTLFVDFIIDAKRTKYL